MSGGGLEYGQVTDGVEADDEDTQQGGGGDTGVCIFLRIRCSVSAALR